MTNLICMPDAKLCRRCRLVAGLFFIFMLALTYGLWRTSVHFLNLPIEEASRQNSLQAIERLTTFINNRLVALRQVSHFYADSEDIKPNEFLAFSSSLMADMPGIQAIVLADREGNPSWVAPPPPDALPMPTIYRLMGDVKTRMTLESALKTQQPMVTGSIDVPELGAGFLGVVPIMVGNRHLGYVVGVFSYQSLLSPNNMLPPELIWRYNVQITHAGWPVFLSPLFPQASLRAGTPLLVSKKTILGGQEWVFSVQPLNVESVSPFTFAPLTILSLGLALSVLLTWFVYRWQWQMLRFQTEARDSQTRLERTGINLLELKSELDLILNSVDEGIILYNEHLEPVQANAAFLMTFNLTEDSEAMRTRPDHHEHMVRLVGAESRYWSLFDTLQHTPEQSYMDELELPQRPETTGTAPAGSAPNGNGGAGAKNAEPARIYLRRATTACGADGNPHGVLVIYKDITKIKAMDRVKDEFLSNVTHELRSPLASIKGFAETLRRDPQMPAETRQEFINIICDEASRLQDLIEELLDLRRMEAQGAPSRQTHYDLKVLAEDVVRGSRTVLLAKNITVKSQWSGIFDARLKGDVAQISRALRNLLINAVKYSPEGGEISLFGHCGQHRIWLEITDQGTGIDEKDLPHIFEKFYRGSRQGRQKGTGLGLAIVKHIVEMHGGHLGVRSEVGKGTSFRIDLPRVYVMLPAPFSPGDTQPEAIASPPGEPPLATGTE